MERVTGGSRTGRQTLAGLAALVVSLACPLRALAAEPEPPHSEIALPPLLVRLGLGLAIFGGRAGVSTLVRIHGRWGAGAQLAAFDANGDRAWFVGPQAGAALGEHSLVTLGGGYARASHDECRDVLSCHRVDYRGYWLGGALVWLAMSGVGLALRADLVADPRGSPVVALGSLNLEFGAP